MPQPRQLSVSRPGEQRRAHQGAEIGGAGIHQPDRLRVAQKPYARFVGLREGLDLAPCGVVSRQPVLERAIQKRLEHVQDPVGRGPPGALFVGSPGRRAVLRFLPAAADPGGLGGERIQPRPQLRRGDGFELQIAEGWQDVGIDDMLGFPYGLLVLPEPLEITLCRLLHRRVGRQPDPALLLVITEGKRRSSRHSGRNGAR